MSQHPLGWLSIVRLGLVQSALGAIVVLTTSTLNRVMVVEFALVASLPAALVAWHYGVQLSRPLWGHGSDRGRRRTPWIVGGMGALAIGALAATNAALMMPAAPLAGTVLGLTAFTLIGIGVGASGTSLLAFLATAVAPERRPAAASITWIMMIVGIVVTAGVAGAWLDPFSPQRLAIVASCVAGGAFLLALLAVWGVEAKAAPASAEAEPKDSIPFADVLAQIWAEPLARRFTVFVFVAMLAYSAQDLILEPFAGLVFGYSVGESTALAGVQHGGVLFGMILVGLGGTLVRGDRTLWLRRGTVFGCAASAFALCVLSLAGFAAGAWPLQPVVFGLGFANGVFAVSAIGLMMSFAGMGAGGREGMRMGVWGAAQAVAFGAGGFAGATGLDLMRHLVAETPLAFAAVFGAEACVFLVAAFLIVRIAAPSARPAPVSSVHDPLPQFGLASGD